MGSTVRQGDGAPSAFSTEMPDFSILTSLPRMLALGPLPGDQESIPMPTGFLATRPRSSSPPVPTPLLYLLSRLSVFFFFFKIFWMWDIFKVFTEFVILLFWFFGCEVCGILVPLTSDRTHTPCTGR